jgi:hypothetical protein
MQSPLQRGPQGHLVSVSPPSHLTHVDMPALKRRGEAEGAQAREGRDERREDLGGEARAPEHQPLERNAAVLIPASGEGIVILPRGGQALPLPGQEGPVGPVGERSQDLSGKLVDVTGKR